MLDGLVFDRRELDASREAAAVFADYRRLMEEVGRLFFARKALIAELAVPGLPKPPALTLAAGFAINAGLRRALESDPTDQAKLL